MPASRIAAVAEPAAGQAGGRDEQAGAVGDAQGEDGDGVDGPAAQVPLRALGVREILLHTGAGIAALQGAPLRPWLAASIAGDVSDIAWTAAARSELPDGAVGATAVVAGGSALVSAAVAVVVDA